MDLFELTCAFLFNKKNDLYNVYMPLETLNNVMVNVLLVNSSLHTSSLPATIFSVIRLTLIQGFKIHLQDSSHKEEAIQGFGLTPFYYIAVLKCDFS